MDCKIPPRPIKRKREYFNDDTETKIYYILPSDICIILNIFPNENITNNDKMKRLLEYYYLIISNINNLLHDTNESKEDLYEYMNEMKELIIFINNSAFQYSNEVPTKIEVIKKTTKCVNEQLYDMFMSINRNMTISKYNFIIFNLVMENLNYLTNTFYQRVELFSSNPIFVITKIYNGRDYTKENYDYLVNVLHSLQNTTNYKTYYHLHVFLVAENFMHNMTYNFIIKEFLNLHKFPKKYENNLVFNIYYVFLVISSLRMTIAEINKNLNH